MGNRKGRQRIIVLMLVTIAVLGLACVVVWRVRVMVSSPVERVPLDFANLQRTGKPNDYLTCPPGFCRAVADESSPEFEIPVLELKKEWLRVVLRQARMSVVSESDDLQLELEQRSWLLNFPDMITVRFYFLEEQRSTMAVYSRSQYGYSDLGVNRRRVEKIRELWKKQ